MEIVIKLLEEAIKYYKTGQNKTADDALQTAIRIRKEVQRGEKRISQVS